MWCGSLSAARRPATAGTSGLRCAGDVGQLLCHSPSLRDADAVLAGSDQVSDLNTVLRGAAAGSGNGIYRVRSGEMLMGDVVEDRSFRYAHDSAQRPKKKNSP